MTSLYLILSAITVLPRARALNSASCRVVPLLVSCSSISSSSLSEKGYSSSISGITSGLGEISLESSLNSSSTTSSSVALYFCLFFFALLSRITCFLSCFIYSSDRLRFSNLFSSQWGKAYGLVIIFKMYFETLPSCMSKAIYSCVTILAI